MKTKILFLLVFICQISFGQVTKSKTIIKKERSIPLNKVANKDIKSAVNSYSPNSVLHHRKSESKSYTIIEDAEFDKLYSTPSNRLKAHETARSRNESWEEEEEIETLKSPRHGRNSIYHHRRSASKGCVTIEDAEFDKLYGNSPKPTSIRKHKKKPSKEGVRTERTKF